MKTMVNRFMLLDFMPATRAAHMIYNVSGVSEEYRTGIHNGTRFSTAKFVDLNELIKKYQGMISGNHPNKNRDLKKWKSMLKQLLLAKETLEKTPEQKVQHKSAA